MKGKKMKLKDAIKEHEQKLSTFFGRKVSYKELKALDEKIHWFNVNRCSEEISEIEQEETENYFFEELLKIVGKENKEKVFLNGDPRGYSLKIPYEIRNKFYGGVEVTDDEYEIGFTSTEDNWKETVKVENVYNRLFAFNRRFWHGVKTFGSNERLTLIFFFRSLVDNDKDAPLDRL